MKTLSVLMASSHVKEAFQISFRDLRSYSGPENAFWQGKWDPGSHLQCLGSPFVSRKHMKACLPEATGKGWYRIRTQI